MKNISTILFDLDATLYDPGSGLWAAIGDRISLYLQTHIDIPTNQIDLMKKTYYESFGTTLRGLQHHYKIDPLHYLDFVHDLPISDFLQSDHELRQILSDISEPKWVFTNSDQAHSNRVLKQLNLSECFQGIISVETMGFQCKPNPEAYKIALKVIGERHPQKVLFLDDSVRNLLEAGNFGFRTVLVGDGIKPDGVDFQLSRPHEIRAILKHH